ncbi:hypothetical protein LPJ53_004005 [Coemansia erecta]|uniref:CCHC-type domain-containing protein n=1 Tax=Coemansia erecta TaxID=147472 RepID=A0A9W7Y0S9_9FUNG|nr:hypothetical protein LPJ53_004005 [Coemansia erecta]
MALPAADNGDPDLLLRVQFGGTLARRTRRKIERYIARALSRPSSRPTGRKRRRYDTSSSSSPSSDECEDPGASGLSITYYDTGFTLDTTADASDANVSYTRATHAVLGLDAAQQGLANLCFNCSLPGHDLRSCPMPADARLIEANRAAFNEKNPQQFASRLYLVAEHERRMDELRAKYAPGGALSDALREALGLAQEGDVPEYVGSMYHFGYPPAYLGCDPEQDPLLVRESRRRGQVLPEESAPETPTLHIYNDAADYDSRAHEAEEHGNENAAERPAPDGDEADSDEEGAISESESEREPERLAEQAEDRYAEDRPYNIPLVRYPGLDLSEFDFDSTSHPGRPLRPKTPRRRSDNLRYEREGRSGGRPRRSRSPQRAHGYGEPYADARHRTPRYSRDDADGYGDPQYAHAAGGGDQWARGGDQWAGMLDGYYRSADHSGSYSRCPDDRDYYDPYYPRREDDRGYYYDSLRYPGSSTGMSGTMFSPGMPMPPPNMPMPPPVPMPHRMPMPPPVPPPMPPPVPPTTLPPMPPPPIPPPQALSFNDDSQGPTTYHSLESSVASPQPQQQNEAASGAPGDRITTVAPLSSADNVSEYDSDVEDGECDMEESD